LPRPTPIQLLKASPILLMAIALLVLVIRNHDTVDFPDYEVPDDYVLAPPPTAPPAGAALPALVASVSGTTIEEVPPNVGTSVLGGTVVGPAGPVPGAIVRLERSIMGTVQVLDVASDAAGQWLATGIGGGRYRVRAFLPPTMASRRAELLLLRAGEEQSVDLQVEQFGQTSAVMASAPSPAVLGQPVNIGVLVTSRLVDGDGFVGTEGVAGASVVVTVSGSWVRTGPVGPVVTNGEGQATVTFTCRQVGPVSATATVRTTVDVAPVVVQATFDCTDPAASTTTTTTLGVGVLPGSTTTTVAGGTTSTTFQDVGD